MNIHYDSRFANTNNKVAVNKGWMETLAVRQTMQMNLIDTVMERAA